MVNHKVLAALAVVSISSITWAAAINWTGDGDGVNYEDGANWSLGSLPAPYDLVFPGAGASITLNSDQEVDSFRTSDGGTLKHIGGTLTIGTAGGDGESFFGEFGPGGNAHNMSGKAALVVNDTGYTMWARSGGVTDTLTMTDSSSIKVIGRGPSAEVWLGMDGSFVGSISGNASFLVAESLQLARYASPSATLELSDKAKVTVGGFLVMSDDAELSGKSSITIKGSGVRISTGGLFMRENATLNFVADASGISTVNVKGPSDLFDNGDGPNPQLSVNLSAYSEAGAITLIDKSNGPVKGQFRGLTEGAIVPGSGGRTITYKGGADGFDVVLVPKSGI